MRIRQMTAAEYEEIQGQSAPDGIEYKCLLPDRLSLPVVEEAFVVESDSGERVAAAIALRVPEIVLVMGSGFHPLVKELAISHIHEEMRSRLRVKGYARAFAVVPPFLVGYVRRMVRKFGWRRDYPAYRIE